MSVPTPGPYPDPYPLPYPYPSPFPDPYPGPDPQPDPPPGLADPGYPSIDPPPGLADPGYPSIDPPPGSADPGNPSIDPPPGAWPSPPEVLFGLDVPAPPHSRPSAAGPRALVALNHDRDEQKLGVETILVGPARRPVTVLKQLSDNQPDGMSETGDRHEIVAAWNLKWYPHSDSTMGWSATMDDDLRPAVINSRVPGTVSWDLPDAVMLWAPAWALYGLDAMTGAMASWQTGTRWIPVREGQQYLVAAGPWSSHVGGYDYVLPLIIEGLAPGSGEVIARFAPSEGQSAAEEAVTVRVVNVDLDLDSDNNNGWQPPDRSAREEESEDALREAGKRVRVNGKDADSDGIPDFLDGFDLDGVRDSIHGEHAVDDEVTMSESVGFVPIVIELPAPIDPARARIRFVYGGSDPAAATIKHDGTRHLAPGGLRLWTVDESQRRDPRAVDDPVQPGHYVTPSDGLSVWGNHYSVAQLTGGSVVHHFTLYLEGIRAGRYGLTVQVDPDGVSLLEMGGQGNQATEYPDLFGGFVLHDSVQVTVESEVTVSAANAVGAETSSPQRPDVATFEVSRGGGDTSGGLMVYYRVLWDDQHAYAAGPVVDPSRKDFDVVESFASTGGLADDPITRIGSVYISPVRDQGDPDDSPL